MSLRCLHASCRSVELVNGDQLAFYQDLNNGGWNLGLSPDIPLSSIPRTIRLIENSHQMMPYNVLCSACSRKIGKVIKVNGFEDFTVNFSATKVRLVASNFSSFESGSTGKWSKMIEYFPRIRRMTASIPQLPPPVGSDTVHFHGTSDIQEMIKAATAVANRSNLNIRRYQWRSYFFACLQNELLCLPTGMGKTLIANMLMKAYRQLNPRKGQVFVVPTIVLVDQQAETIERTTGMKVVRRSGEHPKIAEWSPNEICVCTPAMFNMAVKLRQISMSQLSLLILDEVHEANNSLSEYGKIVPEIFKCAETQRPRVFALTASPSGAKTDDIAQVIETLCTRLGAFPFSPLVGDDKNTDEANNVSCSYLEIYKSQFEQHMEVFVFEILEKLSKFHEFFESNWKEIPQNIAVKIKFDSVIKILSHSHSVATSNDDIELFQLTSFMNKWIDSLEMLRIFGPRTLIDRIKSNLETAGPKDSMSMIVRKPGFLNFLIEVRTKLSFMEHHFQPSSDSTRVAKLLGIIKSPKNNQNRILVFVERRNTAERLCRRLRDEADIIDMHPEFVVGSSTGGQPKEMQQNLLEKFRKGECRVLIATSVLEQGFDVAACGVVICFDGIKSLKSIIQTRGRARKKTADFFVFIDADGNARRKVNELTVMEISMNLAIERLMGKYNSTFSADFEAEMEKFLSRDHEESGGGENQQEIDEDEDEEDEDLEDISDEEMLILKFFNYVDEFAISDYVRRFFKTPHDQIKFSRNSMTVKFFVGQVDRKMGESSIIRNISTESHQSLRSWFEVIPTASNISRSNCPRFSLIFDSLSTFHFTDSTTIVFDENLIAEFCQLLIQPGEITVAFHDCCFDIHPIDVDKEILISETNSSFEIFLCLLSPPKFFKNKTRAPYDFSTRAFNLHLRCDKPLKPEISAKIRLGLEFFCSYIYNVSNLKKISVKNEPEVEVKDFSKAIEIKVWHSRHAAVLPPKLSNHLIKKLLELSSIDALELLLNNFIPERFKNLRIPDLRNVELPFPHCKPPNNYVYISRVKITPSRLIFMPKLPICKNRVLRYFPEPNNFLLINFVDERDGNPWITTELIQRFIAVMLAGIEIAGKRFRFLGCSNSQLREGRCWFSCLDPITVYNKIGEFPNMGPGRMLTRIALAFASSIETIPLNHDRYLRIVAPDIENETGKCFSDGIGRASKSVFTRLSQILGIQGGVSAFQIRVGGVKGVISVFDQQEDVVFRKSMKKFESQHNMLEVLNYSRSLKMTLNRHVILLLSSFGVPDEVFLELQFNELEKIIDALSDDEKSLAFVKSHAVIFDWEMFNEKQIIHEPFYKQILISNTIELVSTIIDKAHIAVEEGRLLMGVLDETGTLNYGEVYAHVVEDGVDMEISGKVIIYRNPCVLPSDIRVVTARTSNLPETFKNLYRNVLVIPSKGKSCHAHECSGGDLDGDLYYVIWDKKLIPPNLPGFGHEVIEVETTGDDQKSSSASYKSMIEFYCDYQTQNQLGIIANAHLATADRLGVFDPKSVELARYVTAETDAPKKGLTVGRLKTELMPTEYPDYMRKNDRRSYRSDTILGKLFRQANPILDVLLEKKPAKMMPTKVVLDDEENSVENFYSLYCFEVRKILQSFELESEVDLFSGSTQWSREYQSTYKQVTAMRETLEKVVSELWKKWKLQFENFRASVGDNKEKIKEWYVRPKSSLWPVHSFSFLALPYIDVETEVTKTISNAINDSVVHWIHNNKIAWLTEWSKRVQVGMGVMQKLPGVECHFYGSSVLGLSEEYSDIDLFAAGKLESLEQVLKSLDKDAVAMKKPHACVSLTFNSYAVDITNFVGGVSKTYSLAEVFDGNPSFWVALRVIIEWARTVKIVKSGGSQGIMNVVSLCHLFVYFATSNTPKTTQDKKPYTLQRLNTWMEAVDNESSGKLIFDFLKTLSDRKNCKWISSRVDPIGYEPLIKSDLVEELCKSAEVAVYILAVHDGDIKKLFQFCSKTRLFKINKNFMNPANENEEEKQQKINQIMKHCNPKNCETIGFELLVRNGSYYLEVTGDHKHFPEVEAGLNRIHSRVISVKLRKYKQRSFHISNSTMIMPEFGRGARTEVSFGIYDDQNFHPHHSDALRCFLELRGMDLNQDWRKTDFERYRERFLKQFQRYEDKQGMAKEGTRLWRFFGEMMLNIRIGNHYLFHVPSTLLHTFESVSIQRVESEITKYEEFLTIEKAKEVVHDFKQNNVLALVPTQIEHKQDPVQVMTFQEAKNKSSKQRKEIQEVRKSEKKSNSEMRHTFYPICCISIEKTENFAYSNGFMQIPVDEEDFYETITFTWRSRELTIECDKNGRINEIRNRKTRWVSSTIKRATRNGGPDVRIYLETQALLDEDESCLKTIIQLLDNSSIFTQDFVAQLQTAESNQTWTDKPLVPDIFKFNWRFHSLRALKPLSKFINSHGDILIRNEVNDGIFNTNRTFEWFPKHDEMEIRLKVANNSKEELCRRSYELSVKLFDFTKI